MQCVYEIMCVCERKRLGRTVIRCICECELAGHLCAQVGRMHTCSKVLVSASQYESSRSEPVGRTVPRGVGELKQ